MPFSLDVFEGIGLTEGLLEALLAEHEAAVETRLNPLWAYYRNEAAPAAPGVRGRLAQEVGLPTRITGIPSLGVSHDDRSAAREIVIENDIAWRVHTMVDFMFGKPVQILSTSDDESQRRIERALSVSIGFLYARSERTRKAPPDQGGAQVSHSLFRHSGIASVTLRRWLRHHRRTRTAPQTAG